MARPSGGAVEVYARRVDGKAVEALVQQYGHMLKRGRVKGLSVLFVFRRAQPPFLLFQSFILCGEPSFFIFRPRQSP